MSDTFNTTPSNWQGVDNEPTAGSNNLIKSGGVINYVCKNLNLEDTFELGKIDNLGNSSPWIYSSSIYNIRTKKGVFLNLNAGDKIICSDYSIVTMYIGNKDDYTKGSQNWITNDFVVPSNGMYVILAKYIDGREVSVDVLGSMFSVFKSLGKAAYCDTDIVPTEKSLNVIESGGVYGGLLKLGQDVENRLIPLQDAYLWGIGYSYKMYGWLDSNLIVENLANSLEKQRELYPNITRICSVIKVFPGTTIHAKTKSSPTWVVFLKKFAYEYLKNGESINYYDSIVSDVISTRQIYSANTTVDIQVPNDANFVIISEKYGNTISSISDKMFESFYYNGRDILKRNVAFVDEIPVVITKNTNWIDGYYLNSSQQPMSFNGFQYMFLDIRPYGMLHIQSTMDGNVAYSFLVDVNGSVLKQWNNEVIDETIDLINTYPTATTLKVCGRTGNNNYVETDKYLVRLPEQTVKQMDYPLLAFNGKYMHFSIDDSQLIWITLINNPTASSIFDTQYFGSLKQIHDATGMCVTVNLFCCNARVDGTPSYTLSDVPDTWKTEFEANSNWLKFALHSYYTDQEYGTEIVGHSLLEDFNYCNTQIKRFAGEKSVSRHLRLGYFNCPSEEDAISIMNVTDGVKMYSTSDDNRDSNMYLNAVQRSEINQKGLLYDNKNELMFIKSMPRLDTSSNITSLVTTAKQFKSSQKLLEMFCHEPNYVSKQSDIISLFLSLKNDYGYQFGFLTELFNN